MWHKTDEPSPEPSRPPSPECARKPEPKLPRSELLIEYKLSSFVSENRGALRCTIEQGRVKCVRTRQDISVVVCRCRCVSAVAAHSLFVRACAIIRSLVANFRQGFCGRGAERYPSGAIYVGDYLGAKRHGRGTLTNADGQLMVTWWKDNRAKGEGAKWSQDHGTAVVRAYSRTSPKSRRARLQRRFASCNPCCRILAGSSLTRLCPHRTNVRAVSLFSSLLPAAHVRRQGGRRDLPRGGQQDCKGRRPAVPARLGRRRAHRCGPAAFAASRSDHVRMRAHEEQEACDVAPLLTCSHSCRGSNSPLQCTRHLHNARQLAIDRCRMLCMYVTMAVLTSILMMMMRVDDTRDSALSSRCVRTREARVVKYLYTSAC